MLYAIIVVLLIICFGLAGQVLQKKTCILAYEEVNNSLKKDLEKLVKENELLRRGIV